MTRVLAGLLAASVVLAGCSSSPPGPAAPVDAERGALVDTSLFLKDLAASFATGSTAQVTFEVRGPLTARGKGVVAYEKNRMDADLALEDWKIKGATVKVRTYDNTTYLQTAESRGVWVDVSSGKGEVPGSMLAEEADPRNQIAALRKEIDEVRFSGNERLGRTATRRYQVVSTAKAKREITDYWFDAKRRVVRRETDLDGTGEALFTWSAWDKPARIVAPPRRSVITFEKLQQLQQDQGQ